MSKKCIIYSIMLLSLSILVGCQEGESGENTNEKTEQTEDKRQTDNETVIAQQQNAFGFQILDDLSEEDTNSNLFISPVSLYTALSMLYPAAENDTKDELADLLRIRKMSNDEWRDANNSLLKTLNNYNGDEIQLDIANSIWVDEHFQLNKDYQKTMNHDFDGKIAAIDGNNENDVEKMNKWVSKQTDGKIDQIAEAPLDDYFAAMLVNAVYFNGKWTYPFDEEATKEDIFYTNEDKEKQVPFMTKEKKLLYTKEENFETVKLPYGEDEELGMYLYLPEEDGDLSSIHQALLDKDMKDMMAEMEQTKGTVTLPKFDIHYEEGMNQVLKSLGLEQAFDEEKADFPHMIEDNDPLHISEVKHQTYLSIEETGTEAAGSTNIEMETTSLPLNEPFDMKFDHPFVMLIADETTGAVLFAGDIWDVSR